MNALMISHGRELKTEYQPSSEDFRKQSREGHLSRSCHSQFDMKPGFILFSVFDLAFRRLFLDNTCNDNGEFDSNAHRAQEVIRTESSTVHW